MCSLTGHSVAVYSVAFSPDGTRFVSGAGDGLVKIWDVQTQTEVRDVQTQTEVRDVQTQTEVSSLIWDVQTQP